MGVDEIIVTCARTAIDYDVLPSAAAKRLVVILGNVRILENSCDAGRCLRADATDTHCDQHGRAADKKRRQFTRDSPRPAHRPTACIRLFSRRWRLRLIGRGCALADHTSGFLATCANVSCQSCLLPLRMTVMCASLEEPRVRKISVRELGSSRGVPFDGHDQVSWPAIQPGERLVRLRPGNAVALLAYPDANTGLRPHDVQPSDRIIN